MQALVPHAASISLVLDVNQAFPASLSVLRVYVNALYAAAIVEVDVPFAVSDGWIDAAPDLAIRVAQASQECGLRYKYRTEVKCEGGCVQALETRLSPGEEVADYLVVEMQLLDSQGNALLTAPGPISPQVWAESVEGNPWDTATCSGTLTCPDCTDVALIRHIVAVNPHEVKIPFELKGISMPALQPKGTTD